MDYHNSKTLDLAFDAAVARTREALAAEGFGVISEIDLRQTFKAKLGEDFRPYTILGACNPKLAFEALRLEDKVGLMLPCNVIVQSLGDGRSEVAAIDPVASMAAIPNAELKAVAGEVTKKLRAVIDSL